MIVIDAECSLAQLILYQEIINLEEAKSKRPSLLSARGPRKIVAAALGAIKRTAQSLAILFSIQLLRTNRAAEA